MAKASAGLAALVVADLVSVAVLQSLGRQAGEPLFGLAESVTDMALLCGARLLLLGLLGALSFTSWRWRSAGTAGSVSSDGGRGSLGRSGSGVGAVPMAPLAPLAPLRHQLLEGDASMVSFADSEGPEQKGPARPALAAGVHLDKTGLDSQKLQSQLRESAELRRDLGVWAMFLVATASAVFAGLKCANFHPRHDEHSLQSSLIGLAVFLSHGEFWMAKRLLLQLTAEPGVSVPWLHPHPMTFMARASRATCQACRTRILDKNHEGAAFCCLTCQDHFYCITCLKRMARQRAAPDASAEALAASAVPEHSVHFYLRRVDFLLRPFRWLVALVVSTVVVNQACALAVPRCQGLVLDAIVHSDTSGFQNLILLYLLVNLLSGLFGSLQSSWALLFLRKLIFRTRSMVFQKILDQDITFFDQNLTGQITSKLSRDADEMTGPVSVLISDLLANGILLVGGLLMCLVTSRKLSIMAMASVIPTTYLVRTYGTWAATIARKISDSYHAMHGVATQAVVNIRTVRTFGTEETELNGFLWYLSRVYRLDMLDTYVNILNKTLSSYLDMGVGVFVLWYGGVVLLNHEEAGLSLGQVLTFQLYWNMMKNSFQGLNNVLTQLLRASTALQRVLRLLDTQPAIDPHRGEELDPSRVAGHLRIEDVEFRYATKHSARPVLAGLSLSLPAGATTALVGRSGSGKTTVVSLLLRMYDPSRGRITLDGEDIRRFRPSALRRCFGVVAQETQLFAGTVEENIAYGLKPGSYTQEELLEAAERSNVAEFVGAFDDGFASPVGDRGVQLSGGQKQRIAIARIFLRRPRILLLDEATSALDTENEAKVQHALDSLVSSGVSSTVLLIAHRLSTVVGASQIAVLHDGELVELGKHQELLDLGGRYAALVAKQLQMQREQLDEG